MMKMMITLLWMLVGILTGAFCSGVIAFFVALFVGDLERVDPASTPMMWLLGVLGMLVFLRLSLRGRLPGTAARPTQP